MKCKNCGHWNERPWFEPVHPPSRGPLAFGEAPTDLVVYARWACEKCRRYHFRDGSLYKNPFASETTEAR